MADLATDQTIIYSAIPTDIGLTKIQLAMTTGVDLILDQLAFGDGNGTTPLPSPDQTSLVNQLGSVPILGHEEDLEDNVTWYSGIIEAGIASGTIRELGLFDRDGNLCFVGNIPDIVLPDPLEGVAINIPIQLGIKNYYSKYISIKTHIKVTEQIAGSGGYSLFDIVQKDHLLSYEESEGFALQGTFVYKEGISGERYGYPDFIQECLKEKNDERTIVRGIDLGGNTITAYIHPNGHIFYNISDKTIVDNYFENTGVAWFWGIDEEHESVYLPRNNYFFKNSSIDPGSFNPATLPSLAHTHSLDIDSSGIHSHTITIGNNGTHSHTITVSPAGGHTHTESYAGTHTHSGTIGYTSLTHYHQGGDLQVTIKGTGILSSSRLTDLVKKGTINNRVVSKGVTYRAYYNNFYSGAIYMDPAEIDMRSTYYDDSLDGTGPSLRTWRVTSDGKSVDTAFPDVNNGSTGWNGGLVKFDSSRYNQTWTGKTSYPVNSNDVKDSLNHNHSLSIDSSGNHAHNINSVADHTHSATNSENGSHTHSATNSENGSHTHSGTANRQEIVSENLLGDTVTPPSTNLLLYIVVGNVRRRPAMVIDEKLEEALETIDEHVEVKKSEIDEYVENKEDVFEEYIQDGIQEINNKVSEVEGEISGYTEEAKEYSTISKEQAEIAEYWAGISIDGQVQANWEQTDPNAKSYIQNKPDLDLANTVYVNKTQTLTNKTINANDNIISNIGLNSLSSELIVTSVTSSSTDTTLATSKAIWDAIQSINITIDNIDPSLIINSISQSSVSNNTLATSKAIWDAIQNISHYSFITNSITESTASDSTIGTSLATWEAIQSVNAGTVQLIENVDQAIRSIPIVNKEVIDTIDNPVVVSDNSLPTSSAVYKAILNTLGKTKIEGGGIVRATTKLNTTTDIQTSNPGLIINSSYTGPQSNVGVIIYEFNYNGNHWELNGVTVDLEDYDLTVTGAPGDRDVITLTYTTTSTTVVKVDLGNIADLVDYYSISHTPNYVFTKGVKSTNSLDTQTFINSSNTELVISTTYQPVVEGEEIYNFSYIVNEEDSSLTGWYIGEELVDLSNYNVSVMGTPQDGDEFTITYETKNYTYISTDIDYTNGLTASDSLKTSVQVYCSNNLVTIKSTYNDTKPTEGIINYTFQYEPISDERVGWIDISTQEEVDLSTYDLVVYGDLEIDDLIYLSYITTKGKTVVSVDLATIDDLTTSNFSPGVITTSIRSASAASDSAIPTEKAVRDAINDVGGGGGSGSVTPESDTIFKNKTIDADDNTITDLSTSNFKSGVLQTTVRAASSASDGSIPSERAVATALSNMVDLTSTQTLTNKTINANNNTVSNLSTSNFKSGVLQTTVRAASSASDGSIPSERAVATALSNTVDLTSTQTISGSKTLSNLNSTTQSLTVSNTTVATTKFARNLQSYQVVNTFSNGNIILQDDVSIYSASDDISTETTFTFDTSNLHYLNSSSLYYTFEMGFKMTTVSNLIFPDESILTWQNGEIPDFSETGTYLLAFRTMDGTHWIGNLQGMW